MTQEVVSVGLSQNADTATIMDQAEQTLMKALDDKAGTPPSPSRRV